MFPPRRSLPTAALAVVLIGVTPAVAPALADTTATASTTTTATTTGDGQNDPPMIATGECITGAPVDKPKPISETRVKDLSARVDIRGGLTVTSGVIGPLEVRGCASTLKGLVARTYLLVKAPTTPRYVVALTKWTTTTGTAGTAPTPSFASEAAFSAAIKPMTQKLTIPGIAGTVFGPTGSPFALMAKKVNGKTYSSKAKQVLATKYIGTGGYVGKSQL